MLRAGRVVGRLLRSAGDVVFLEPCRDWAGCHVWKLYSARDIFSQEQEAAWDHEGGGEVRGCLDRNIACHLHIYRSLTRRRQTGWLICNILVKVTKRRLLNTASSFITPIRLVYLRGRGNRSSKCHVLEKTV